jgi:hypothetical protein
MQQWLVFREHSNLPSDAVNTRSVSSQITELYGMPRTTAVEDLAINCVVLARVTSHVLMTMNGCQRAWNMTIRRNSYKRIQRALRIEIILIKVGIFLGNNV